MQAEMHVAKLDSRAVIPERAHDTDVGLDITAIDVDQKRSTEHIKYLRTGLVVQPPAGYYFELHVRSSFHKTGWTLANNVGIVDPEYRGEILMAIAPLYAEAKLPALPMRVGQLILRKLHNDFTVKEVSLEDLTSTQRGAGGFGSTGK